MGFLLQERQNVRTSLRHSFGETVVFGLGRGWPSTEWSAGGLDMAKTPISSLAPLLVSGGLGSWLPLLHNGPLVVPTL